MRLRSNGIARGILLITGIVALSIAGGFLGGHLSRVNSPSGVQFAVREPAADFRVALPSGTDVDVSRAFQQQFRSVAEATLPVVVQVNVISRGGRSTQPSLFDFFGPPRDTPQEGMGSGVIVARNASTVYVVTNEHVTGQSSQIEVVLHDARTYRATIVGTDSLMDIALLSFETTENVPIAPLGNSETLRTGDWVFAVGNPLGFQSSVTAGIVSATARPAQAGTQMSGVTDYIQTDAAINRGNSGGPLVNLDGEVVGINTWIASQTGGSIGLGFAIPINNARRAINDFIETGEVAYSWLGVRLGTVTDGIGAELKVPDRSGALVIGTFENSPAERWGIRPGDVITRVGETRITDSGSLIRTIASLQPGTRLAFAVVRDGASISVDVETGRRNVESGTAERVWPGLSVAPIDDATRSQLSLARTIRGVVVSDVEARSPAAQAGLRAADAIISINGSRIDSISDFYRALNDDRDDVIQFRLIRNGRQLVLEAARPG